MFACSQPIRDANAVVDDDYPWPQSVTSSQLVRAADAVEPSTTTIASLMYSDLGMSAHMDQVLASCASSMYALRVLRCHGLLPPQLHKVARATTIASLMYASPSWWGFSSAKDRSPYGATNQQT